MGPIYMARRGASRHGPSFLDPPGFARHRPKATLLYQLVEQNDDWQLQRRYMSLETLRTLSDNHPLGCPPWSAEHESR